MKYMLAIFQERAIICPSVGIGPADKLSQNKRKPL